MKIAVKPRSDQWNADDFTGGPRTFTIAGVKPGVAEAPYDIELVEGGGRVWRPPNGMLSVLIQLWGDDAPKWTGRRVTLFKDKSVRFGKEVPGGIRISHMSDIGPKAVSPSITVSRGRRAPYPVQPLVESQQSAPSGPPVIPADVIATIAKAVEAGTLADYLAYATTNNAPAHIVDHIKTALRGAD